MSEIELSGVETSATNGENVVELPNESASHQPLTPTETPPVVEVQTAAEPVDQNEEQLKTALRGLLNVEQLTDFGDLIDKCSVQELTLLMEELSVIPLSRDNIRKVGKLKTRFDTLKEAHIKDIKQQDADAPETKELKESVDNASKRFSAALAKFNQRKNEFETQEQKSREENTVKKKQLLEKLMAIVQKDDFTAIDEVRSIQEEWKNTGPVVQAETEALFQTYRTYSDQFYTQRQRYLGLLEQSRQVNLEQKRQLVKEAQALIPEDPDSVNRTYWQETGEKVKILHEQWRTVGPVPKAESDKVWNEFKEATDKFYAAKRDFFKELDDARAQNATQKREILERLTAVALADYDSIDAWKQSTDEVKELREKWKTIGPAPSNENEEINKSFTDKINHYFDKRTAYFNELDKSNEEVLRKKEELLEKAEALKDSEDWKKATDELIELQRLWNEVGDDSFKDARKLRKRFRKACDTFFRRKKDHVSTIQQGEMQNLQQKEALRDQIADAINKFKASADYLQSEDALNMEKLVDLRENFESVGRVPLAKKDTIQKEFEKTFNEYLELLVPDQKEREKLRINIRSGNYSSGSLPSSASPQRIEREEKQIIKRIQSLKEKITQFENNFFFISQSKSSDVFRKDIEAKIAEARTELDKLEKQKDTLKELRKSEKEKERQANAKPAEATAVPSPAETPTTEATAETSEVTASVESTEGDN